MSIAMASFLVASVTMGQFNADEEPRRPWLKIDHAITRRLREVKIWRLRLTLR